MPACPEASCSGQRSYSAQSVITGNTLVNNGGNVFLSQDSNRFCSDGSDSVCTLVNGGPAGPFTLSSCKANLPSASINETTYVGNHWFPAGELVGRLPVEDPRTLRISRNVIDFNPADIPDCNRTDWPDCGAGGIYSEYGSTAPYDKPGAILSQLTFFQNNSWSDNTYNGPSTFYA